ncbi:hypothetical protein Hanom_Chr05g00413761 [Helianthus anomalus]
MCNDIDILLKRLMPEFFLELGRDKSVVASAAGYVAVATSFVDNFLLVVDVFSVKIENLCMDLGLLLLISLIWFLGLFLLTTFNFTKN